jgi:hypothetical protein
MHFLIRPNLPLIHEVDIEIPQNLRKYELHLRIGKPALNQL